MVFIVVWLLFLFFFVNLLNSDMTFLESAPVDCASNAKLVPNSFKAALSLSALIGAIKVSPITS